MPCLAGDSADDSQQWFNSDDWQSGDIDFDSVMLQSGEDLGISSLTMREITDQLLCSSDMKEVLILILHPIKHVF